MLTNGQVAPAPLGRMLTRTRTFPRPPPFASAGDRLFVAATGHSLSGRFLQWWRQHRGAILLGAPISEVVTEGDGSGRRYAVQWFENGRLEYHPELARHGATVELGLTGAEAMAQRGWAL